jgi:hypothetical protein
MYRHSFDIGIFRQAKVGRFTSAITLFLRSLGAAFTPIYSGGLLRWSITKPSDIPDEQPSKFELAINLATALVSQCRQQSSLAPTK